MGTYREAGPIPVALPQFTAAWPKALVDFGWGVRTYAYFVITAALGCGLAGYLLSRAHPPRSEAFAIVRVKTIQDGLGLEKLLHQPDFLTSVAREARIELPAGATAFPADSHVRTSQWKDEVAIHVLSTDPILASDIANAVVQEWLELSASGKQVLLSAQPPDPGWRDQPGAIAFEALVGALLLGCLLTGMNEVLRATFRVPGDISASLQVLELGTIPDCRPGNDPTRQKSLVTTAFRSLLQSLWSTGTAGKRPRVVVVASPNHGAGCSTVAANLALAFAGSSRWVLLIDANGWRPEVHQTFSVSNRWGLANALREDTDIDLYDFPRLFRRSEAPGLWVLPAGTGPLDFVSARAQERLSDLLARARLEFHTVIVDTTAGPSAELCQLASSSDGVLLVVRASKTSRRSALKLTRQFSGNGIEVVGAVLNDWRPGAA